MRNLTVQFTYPWLLLLLIPAAALTAFLYLRLNKKFRKNRNRIVSLVLHCIVSVLCVFALSGITFRYEVSNSENELILLVDVSDTTEGKAQERREFIHSVLSESEYNGCRTGIVTFGFTQENAVPFTYNADRAYDQYLEADLPDTSATDIAAALQYAQGLFEHPETGKIVLISDGKQTDEEAMSVIRAIAAQGVTVDTVYFPSDYSDEVVQISGIGLPTRNVRAGESCTIEVTVESRKTLENVTIALFDNGSVAEGNSVTVNLMEGAQNVSFEHVFAEQGLHELYASVEYNGESLHQNNVYYAYRWLQVHNRVLILEQAEQHAQLVETLEEDAVGYQVDIVNIVTGQGTPATVNVPATVDDLRAYDQVILNNVSNEDLGKELVDLLYEYVHDYGGGLFTTGGLKEDGETANAYHREDMNNTLYQQMLPVQVINYTPPVGVFVVIDISGSMLAPSDRGMTKLEWAKEGALACLDALTERDYIGIMTMDTEYGMVLDLTPRTQDTLIRDKIKSVGEGKNTVYSTAIDRAAQRLVNLENVEKRHIILVTDGLPADSDKSAYLQYTKEAYENHGITLSVVGINIEEGSDAETDMKLLAGEEYGHGRYVSARSSLLLEALHNELNSKAIKEMEQTEFSPIFADPSSRLLNGVGHGEGVGDRNTMDAKLGGFFGVKARRDAEVVLANDYGAPIYAQWEFGKGMVGSFMCDVYGNWSSEFMADEDGKCFLRNVVANLMPVEDISPGSVRLELTEENYINRLTVYSDLRDGEYLDGNIVIKTAEGTVSYPLASVSEDRSGDVYVTVALGRDNSYSRANFIIKKGGVYQIVVNKHAQDGTVLETATAYKAFSYSKEFDYSVDRDPEELMADLAERGNGIVISAEEYWEIFSTFVVDLQRVFDPRWLFIGTAMVLFLLDIAVRKFKFKWLHEIIRERKEKKADRS